jgi:putative ABC transport system permease protein
MTLREWFGRLAAWRRRRELDEALDAELEGHLALVQRDLEAQGMDAATARASARRQLGNLTAIREESREAWGFPALTVLRQDLGYAVRGLRRAPGFTAAAVLTLALGIGANAAMFGVLDRLLFRPFPYLRDPAAVNRVYLETTFQGRTNANVAFPYARYLDLAREAGGFAQVAAMSEWRLGVGGAGEDAQVRKVAGVSASFFGFFDAPPALGRYFLAEEDSVPLGRHVAVISHAFWREAFGGADVIGRPLKVGRFVHTIVGVAPAGFVGTVTRRVPDLFVPITTIPANLGESAN